MSLAELREAITRVLESRREILEAYLFGSGARGRHGPLSDVDVAVYLDLAMGGSHPFGYAANLSTGLMRERGADAVDVVVLNQPPPLLYHRVLRDGVRLLSRSLRETTTREGYALPRYCDFVPQLYSLRSEWFSAWPAPYLAAG
jgi:predicted nucleotidyltransferase